MNNLHYFKIKHNLLKLNLVFLFFSLIIFYFFIIQYIEYLSLKEQILLSDSSNKKNDVLSIQKIPNNENFNVINNIKTIDDYFIFIEKTATIGLNFETIIFNFENNNYKKARISCQLLTESPQLITNILDFNTTENNILYNWKINNFLYNENSQNYSLQISFVN